MPVPKTARNNWNRRLGRQGEDAAARALADHGYRIAARNVRTPAGELDLVAERDGWTVLVEVKARRSRAHGLPEEAVTAAKKARLLAAAQCYLQERSLLDSPWRIDVIAVEYGADGQVLRCEIYENAVTG